MSDLVDTSSEAVVGRPTSTADLSADAVRTQRFDTSFRGYDTTQVRAYLQRVAAQVSRLHEQVGGLTLELESARSVRSIIDISEATDRRVATTTVDPVDETAANTIAEVAAERDAVLDAARREAKLIVSPEGGFPPQVLPAGPMHSLVQVCRTITMSQPMPTQRRIRRVR
jgi:DivIVA domain-containing protein